MILTVFGNRLRDSNTLLVGLLIFLAAGILAFSVMAAIRVRSVKRRTARILSDEDRKANHARSLQYSSQKTVAKLIDYTTKHYGTANDENMKVLRRRLVQAGIYDPRGPWAHGLGGRPGLCKFPASAACGVHRRLVFLVGGDGRRRCRRTQHLHRQADFRALSMEASLERVSRELGPSYPSLTANIHLTNLEIRAGRQLKDALENFADRLALEEARAFATLINQSIDLGSSITDAMRVYSDDMRHAQKRRGLTHLRLLHRRPTKHSNRNRLRRDRRASRPSNRPAPCRRPWGWRAPPNPACLAAIRTTN